MSRRSAVRSLAPFSIARFVLLAALFTAALAFGAAGGQAATKDDDGGGMPRLVPVQDHGKGDWFRNVCLDPSGAAAGCGAQVVSNASGDPLASTTPPSSAYGPAQFHTGYSLPTLAASGTPTIAIVDAFDDPSIEADLGAYDSFYGLPACTTANGCFRKVNQNGGTTYPSGTSWHLEIALDVETAHQICQNCKILLVEATTNSLANLGAAVNRAVTMGANVVSNSYGAGEYSGETSDENAYFKHPGVAITASSGDGGYGVEFPAASQYVTAVGGTTLHLNSNQTYQSESVWSGSGSGCSAYEPKPAWQTDTGCTRRTVADVSADADPNTGAAIYDSVGTSGGKAWYQVGGTSLSAPLVGAVYALAGDTSSINFGSTPYSHAASLHDVISGSNGSCGSSYLCTAKTGFDGPTGLGTPNGTAAFATAPPSPSFTLAVTPPSSTVAVGASATYTVTVTGQNGFSGAVALSVSGVPAGATPSFSPSSTTTTSTLTVTTTAGTTPAGSSTLTITGTSAGAPDASTTATLIVQAPTFTLSPSPATRTITAGGGTSYTISINPANGFASPVTLSTGSLPTGVTASFDTNPATSSSVLTITTTPAAAAGTDTIAISGTGGGVTAGTTVALVVQPPPPSLSADPASVSTGGTVTATWGNVTSPSSSDWIAVYVQGAANTAYLSWVYDSSCTTSPGTARAAGSCTLTMPSTAGTYELRLLANNGYTVLATSGAVTVTAATKATPTLSTTASTGVTVGGTVNDTATLTGGSSPGGTITFNLYGPTDTSCTGSPVFTSTANVSSAHATSQSFTPSGAGTYRWIAAYSGDGANNAVAAACGAANESVTVTAATGVTLTVAPSSAKAGSTVTVSWSGVPAPSTTDWIGVYTHSAANTAYLNWIYTSSCSQQASSPAKASGSCSFKLPNSAGTYEFRLLANNGFTLLATSSLVTAT